ncbi:MAG: exopolysaccharide biosynthesis protein [Dichotomicrobium sp.]
MTSDESSHAENRDYSLIGLFDDVLANVEGSRISFGEAVATFREQAYGPILLVPSLLALVPIIGAIPGVSVLTATLIILIAGQMLVGRRSPWLPQRLSKLSLTRRQLERALNTMRPYLAALDRWTRPRLLFLSEPPVYLLIPIVCILLALMMFPLAFVPWGVTPPALALTILSVGLTVRDGYVLGAGYVVTAFSLLSAVWFL